MPLEVSYSSALREMSTEDFESALVEISGRTPANAPAICSRPSALPKKSLTAASR